MILVGHRRQLLEPREQQLLLELDRGMTRRQIRELRRPKDRNQQDCDRSQTAAQLQPATKLIQTRGAFGQDWRQESSRAIDCRRSDQRTVEYPGEIGGRPLEGARFVELRSEERRVGKECRSR